MLYQGIIGGGSSPVEPVEPVLLWTNPSPTSNFGTEGQINYVEADLTNYECVIIEYYHNTSDTRTGFFMNKVSDLPLSANGNQIGLGTSYSGIGVCRPVVKNSDNKLGFYGAVDGKGTGLSYCIPVHVYGINGLAV